MVTGTLPWSTENQIELFRQIKQAEVEVPAHLSPQLQELLSKMLQRDPARRLIIGEVLDSSWFLKTQNGPWKTLGRAATNSPPQDVTPQREDRRTSRPASPEAADRPPEKDDDDRGGPGYGVVRVLPLWPGAARRKAAHRQPHLGLTAQRAGGPVAQSGRFSRKSLEPLVI
jgi:serine/threonine protein kinase